MGGVATTGLSQQQCDRILKALAGRLQIVLTCPTHVAAGNPITAALVPGLTELDASDLLDGALDLAGVVKDLLFKDTAPAAVPDPGSLADPKDFAGDELLTAANGGGNVLGGVPFGNTNLGLPLGTVALPPAVPVATNISGLTAQLFGKLSLPSLKVKMELTWKIRSASGTELGESRDFVAPNGLGGPSLSVTVAPALFKEYRLDTLRNPGGSLICVSLDVKLSIGSFVLPFSLGPIPVIQLPLLIPTVVALFSEPDFDLTHDSAAMIVVPEHSPFSSAEGVIKVLQRLESTTSALRSVTGLAGFFLGLDDVLGSLPQQPRLRFAAHDQIDELGNYTIKRRPWYNPLGSDRTFDDTVNSLFVFGAPGTEVEFFNDEFCKDNTQTDQGGYTITLGSTFATSGELPDFFVSIRTLYANNDVAPPTFPPGRITVFDADGTGDDSWDTDMSSLRFSKAFRTGVDNEIARPASFPRMLCKRPVPPKPRKQTNRTRR